MGSNLGKSASGIREIAQTLGISIATVHRALHNQGRISPKTRARVLQVAAELEYRPNIEARDLRRNRHFRVSVHFPLEIAAFFDALQEGIEEGAVPYRSHLDIQFHRFTRSAEEARKSIQAALDAGVDGVIMVPANTAQIAQLVRKAKGVSFVYVSTDAPESGRLTAVTAHPFYCGTMAAEILAASARSRGEVIVLAGDLENLNQTEKVRGFRTMLAQAAPSLSLTSVLETHDSPRAAALGIRQLVQGNRRICGLYVTSANSLGALTALREVGRLGRISVVTTDLFPDLVPFIEDGSVQATIYQCPEMQGSVAIRAMYNYLMEGKVPVSSIGLIPQLVMKSNLDLYMKKSWSMQNTTTTAVPHTTC